MTSPANPAMLPASPAPARADAMVAVALIGIVMLMILPLPRALMDLLLGFNFSFSLLLLCVAVYLKRPLEFSVFPTLLLLATLLRLGLNVASTRLVLLHGHEGTAAAGRIIETFGKFVVGGNYVVGGIVFLILVIINFVVITKGAGRVAEVAARFTLDALPGKQMSIDAELASGAIGETQARERRAQVEREADFYGAMDGASKFVRGDAIAGLIITAVNLIGGLLIGVGQQNLAAGDAAAIYGLLAIGDGLTSQIPALLVSTAAGVVITRTASRDELGSEILSQLSQKQRGSRIVAGLLFAMGFVPGMPTLILWGLSGLAFWLSRGRPQAAAAEAAPPPPAAAPENPEALREMLPVDTLELELGYSLVRLVEKDADGDLLGRIRAIRRQFAMDLGFVVPPIHIRDNLRLPPDLYRVLLRGAEIGRGRIVPDRLMAMAPAQPAEVIAGQPGVEPAFGIDVVWISADQRSRAERAGYTVVDGSTVIATHLTELVRRHAAELLGRTEVQDLLEVVARRSPKLVEDLIPGALTLAEVTRVLRLLLAEGVSIRDLATILETLAEEAGRTRDPAMLCELVRARLAPSICQKAADEEGRLHAIFLDPAAERLVRERLLPGERGGALSLDLEEIRNWTRQIQEFTATAPVPPLLVVPGDLRRALSDLLRRFLPALSVLSLHEVQTRAEVRTVGLLRASERRMPAGAPAAPSLSPNRAAAPAR